MDAARDILIQYNDGLITLEEAILKLHTLAILKEISLTVATGFISDMQQHGRQ